MAASLGSAIARRPTFFAAILSHSSELPYSNTCVYRLAASSDSTQVSRCQIKATSSPREDAMLERTRPLSPFYTGDHEAFRDVMRRFVAREIEPYASEWDEAGEFPRSLYVKAAEVGLLGLGFPEEYGGVPA